MTIFRCFMTICLTLGIMMCPLMVYSAGPDCGDGSSGGGFTAPAEYDYPPNWAHFWMAGPTAVASPTTPGQCIEFTMSGGCGQVAWQVAGSQGQGGASIDPVSGCVTLTAAACGNYSVTGADQCNNTVNRTFLVTNNGVFKLRADLYHFCGAIGNPYESYECTVGAFKYALGLGDAIYGRGCASPCGEGGSYGGLDVLYWNVYEWQCP